MQVRCDVDSLKPKRFSEAFPNESPFLVDTLLKSTNHELLVCGKCSEPIRTHDEFAKVKFCTKCGTMIDWSDRYNDKNPKSCPNCYVSPAFKDQFCRQCGSELIERKDFSGMVL